MPQKTRIVHLFDINKGSRYPAMISQGLWIDPDIEVSFSSPFISMGSCICARSDTLEEDLRSADYIFRANDEHFAAPDIDEILARDMLWSKVIYYDFRDTPAVDEHRLRNCCVYVKRSWPIGCFREPRKVSDARLFPMDYGLLNEYFEVLPHQDKAFDLACLFPFNPQIGMRRYVMLEELTAARDRFGSSHIGNPTTSANVGRRAVLNSPENNPWLTYLRILKQACIVFTARPDHWDGDSRTWEAFASGAMVFMDRSYIPDAYRSYMSGTALFSMPRIVILYEKRSMLRPTTSSMSPKGPKLLFEGTDLP